ncbi:PD-(D/E)XK motif protein [Arthrobacter ruber]|uniref:PD-(D/E)XK motif protein n=1 Tax=Arthrobacter ruber TaxID=1258893 RepID=UPI000CF48346|nr:PD-(D/E)XK motif protein [Arthrobacter ruber]
MQTDVGIQTVWSVLGIEKAGVAYDFQWVDIEARVQAGAVRAAIDSEGLMGLLIPLTASDIIQKHDGAAVRINQTVIEGQQFASVFCTRPVLEDIFALFVEAVTRELPSTGPISAALDDTYYAWRELLAEKVSPQLLTAEKQIGLLGELAVLTQLLSVGAPRSLGYWTGPLNSQHDFRCGEDALEVKSTFTREGRRAKVSGALQLCAPEEGSLYLAWYRFEPSIGGKSVPMAVQEALEIGADRAIMKALLRRAGYNPAMEEDYASFKYKVVEHGIYRVDGDVFPRIIPRSFVAQSVPAGTYGLSYFIDLSASGDSQLDDSAKTTLFSHLAEVAL